MSTFALCAALAIASLIGLIWSDAYLWRAIGFGILTLLGIWDVMQERHSVLRNYPILGHIRYLFESGMPPLKWSGKLGQRAKMYPTRTTGYENDEATGLFGQG